MIRRILDLNVRTKLIGLVVCKLLLLGAAFMTLFHYQVSSSAQVDSIAQARRVVDLAESVREGESDKWNCGVFDQETVRKWADEGNTEKVLSSVPIVSAWKAVMRKSDQGNYVFKTPRADARNPENEPDDLEARALNSFAKENTDEYVEFNKETNSIHYFRPIRLTKECMMCHGDPATSLALWGNDRGIDPTGYTMEGLKVGDLHGAFEVIQSLDETDAKANKASVFGLILILFMISLACATLTWVLNRTLIRPLTETVSAFGELVCGNLKRQLPVRCKDEIGQLQAGFNSLVGNLRQMFLSLQCSSNQLGTVSESLDSAAQRVGGAANDTTGRSITVSAAAEQMSQGLNVMSQSVNDLRERMRSVAGAASQVEANAAQVAANTCSVAEMASRAYRLAEQGTQQIRTLEDAAQNIDDIVMVIQDITDQTHLLALNATIEASRAGDAGKGFAVVASEVKALASETGSSTAEIRGRVESIQVITKQMVETITAIAQSASQVHTSTQEVSAAVDEQRRTISNVSEELVTAAMLTDQVTLGITENSSAAGEVCQRMHEVKAIAASTANEVHATSAASSELKEVSGTFRNLISSYSI